MLTTERWKNQVTVASEKLQEWRTRSEAVIVLEQDGILEARAVSYSSRNNYEIELNNIVSIIAVETYREGVMISQLYNKMVNRGIKVKNLQKVVQAVEILGSGIYK